MVQQRLHNTTLNSVIYIRLCNSLCYSHCSGRRSVPVNNFIQLSQIMCHALLVRQQQGQRSNVLCLKSKLDRMVRQCQARQLINFTDKLKLCAMLYWCINTRPMIKYALLNKKAGEDGTAMPSQASNQLHREFEEYVKCKGKGEPITQNS